MALDGVTKHPNLWFDDGNIILVAENVGFCVYQGIITKQSEVFRDRLTKKPMSLLLGLFRVMFEIPQPSTVDSNFGGRRVVYLNDDGADEVATVLDLLFDARHRYVAQIVFAFVNVILCIYNVASTRTRSRSLS